MTPALEGEFRRQYEAVVEAEAAVDVKIAKLQTLIFDICQVYLRKQNRFPIRGMFYRWTRRPWFIIRPHIRKEMLELQREWVQARKRVIYYQDRAEAELQRVVV